MSAQRVSDQLRNAQSGERCLGDGDQEREIDVGGGDVESVEDIVCFHRRSPVVTTALGLMGFQVPQVCNLMMKHWMDTVHALLRHDRLTPPTLRRILENVDVVLRDVKGQPLLELIEALLKAAVQMKTMSPKNSSDSWTFARTKCSGESSDAAWAIEKILEYVVKEKSFLYDHFVPIARLQVWRLRPSLLKMDLSDLAKEAMKRPLLPLREESGSRAFGFMVASLALAPDLLSECRRLLLMWSDSVRAVRLLELRTQLTVTVHDILQQSNASGSATLADECVWSLTMDSSSLRPFHQILVGVPSASALSHLVELMERREFTARAAAKREAGLPLHERSPKRQRRRCAIADQKDAVLDDSSSNIDISGSHKETAGLRTKTSALLSTDFCNVSLDAPATAGSLECVDNGHLWTLLADFLPWSTFALQLLFQDFDEGGVRRQIAADFLGWFVCPSSPEGRAYATAEFLHAAADWLSLCDEGIANDTQTLRNPGVARRLSNLKNIGGENFSPRVCNFCGSPADFTGLKFSSPSAFQNVVAWLLRFCSLQSQLQQQHLKGCKSVCKREGYVDGMWEVIRAIPIAALSCDLSFLTPEVGGLLLSMSLLGLTSGSQDAPTAAKSSSPRSCCTACEDFHCVRCCYKDRPKSSEPPHRTEQIKNDARIAKDFSWAPVAAALFTYLDTTSRASSAEPSTPTSDSIAVVRRVVATCVRHWVQLTNASTLRNSQSVEFAYHRSIEVLEDLYTRILAWAGLVGDDPELAQALECLTQQIEQLKQFCNI